MSKSTSTLRRGGCLSQSLQYGQGHGWGRVGAQHTQLHPATKRKWEKKRSPCDPAWHYGVRYPCKPMSFLSALPSLQSCVIWRHRCQAVPLVQADIGHRAHSCCLCSPQGHFASCQPRTLLALILLIASQPHNRALYQPGHSL